MPLSPTIRCVIFDCDGTLVDSERLGTEVLVGYAAEFGLAFDLDEAVERFTGGRMSECIEVLQTETGVRLPDDFLPALRDRMSEVFEVHLQAMPFVHDLLDALALPRCVASSGPRRKTAHSLSITELSHHFEERIYSAYDVGHWKPEPHLFRHAAADMGYSPQQCLVVEDSDPGIEAGLNAGMHVVGLGRTDTTDTGVIGVADHRELSQLLIELGAY